jgi:hypothetical protein
MSYEGDPVGLARAVLDGSVHRQPNGDHFVDHVYMLARALVDATLTSEEREALRWPLEVTK